ncbi:uncharacterized protein LOC141908441 [Tubulanus polymorphus]|uniref:uncharacterized protein LOC141908441 n=1 Tax=Tubulanus polymorphus TaxID=672921 RepID=UPI003DA2EAB2
MPLMKVSKSSLKECLKEHLDILDEIIVAADDETWYRWHILRRAADVTGERMRCISVTASGNIKTPGLVEGLNDVSSANGNDMADDQRNSQDSSVFSNHNGHLLSGLSTVAQMALSAHLSQNNEFQEQRLREIAACNRYQLEALRSLMSQSANEANVDPITAARDVAIASRDMSIGNLALKPEPELYPDENEDDIMGALNLPEYRENFRRTESTAGGAGYTSNGAAETDAELHVRRILESVRAASSCSPTSVGAGLNNATEEALYADGSAAMSLLAMAAQENQKIDLKPPSKPPPSSKRRRSRSTSARARKKSMTSSPSSDQLAATGSTAAAANELSSNHPQIKSILETKSPSSNSSTLNEIGGTNRDSVNPDETSRQSNGSNRASPHSVLSDQVSDVQNGDSSAENSDKKKPFKCEGCDLHFQDYRSLREHINAQYGADHFKCDFCGRGFPYPGNLQIHRRSHTGPTLNCPKCGKTFYYVSSLRNHMKLHSFECKECGKNFSSLEGVHRHQKSTKHEVA